MASSQPPFDDGSAFYFVELFRNQITEALRIIEEIIDQDPQAAREILRPGESTIPIWEALNMFGIVQSMNPIERSLPDATEPIGAISRANSEGAQPSILSILSDSDAPLQQVNTIANDIAACQQSAAAVALPLPCTLVSPPHNSMPQGWTQQTSATPSVSQPPQPPLPQEPMTHLQMSHNMCCQLSAVQSHPIFQAGGDIGQPSSSPQGCPWSPSGPPHQQHGYQGSVHMDAVFEAQGAPWAPTLPQNRIPVTQLSVPPPLPSGQMAPGSGISSAPQQPMVVMLSTHGCL